MFVNLPEPDESATLDLIPAVGTRVKQLFERGRRVAWLYESLDSSTFRYRAANMVASVSADHRANISASWFTGDELGAVEAALSNIDILVITRFRYSTALHGLILRAKLLGVRVLFDCDDLVFDVRYATLVADTLAQDLTRSATWDYWFSYMGRLNFAASLCDGGITTNDYLASCMRETLVGKPVGVVPNFLNEQQQAYSEKLLEFKHADGWRRNKRIHVGYFSGSPTHRYDFAVAAPALVRLLKSHPEVHLRIVGFLDCLGPLAEYGDRIEIVKHMDYVSLQRAIAEVEISIAPLQENVFTNCKSELKYFEAAAVGVWTIATPTFAFRASIEDGVTGRLARAFEWDDALAEGIDLVQCKSEYVSKVDSAAKRVHVQYGWNKFAHRIASELFGCGEFTRGARHDETPV